MIWAWLVGERRSVLSALARRPPMPIAKVHDGHRAAIAGTVTPIELVKAPLSRRPCVYWRVDVEEVGANDFHVCGRAEGGGAFLVRDGSGVARVLPAGARLALAVSSTRHGFGDPMHVELFRFANARRNYESSGTRFREYLIAPAAQLHLAGHATREPDPDTVAAPSQGYRGDLATRPVFARARLSPLLIASYRVDSRS